MALTLDTRQRAMLQDMGVTVWLPAGAASPAAPASLATPTAPAQVATAMATAATAPPTPVAVPVAAPIAAAPVAAPHATPSTALPATAPTVANRAPQATEASTATWRMAAPVQAYPQATAGQPDDGWLVIWECAHPHAPLEGDSGKLLNNMLRALRLHHSPHVWIAGLQRSGYEALPVAGIAAADVAWQDLSTALPLGVAHTRPARILVLGLQAARAVLDSQEALGRLRAQVHQLHGVPAVVSYDPAYLLRSPHAKPAAWTDLCRAHALRPPSAP